MSYPQGGGYPPQGGYQPGGGFPPPQQYGGYGAPPPMQYADVGKRIGAYFIDYFLAVAGYIPGFIIVFIGGAMGGDLGAIIAIVGTLLAIVGILGVVFYNIYLLGRDGATLGKRWMKVKVLDPQGQPLGFGKAFLRELVKGAVGGACFILLLWPMWDQEKQGLQDKVFNTHVYNA